VAREEEKPDILHVKRDSDQGAKYHFYYNREERLKMKFDPDDKDAVKRRKMRKIGKFVFLFLGIAIFILISMLVYKYFFQ
jgi:hypothetical protein